MEKIVTAPVMNVFEHIGQKFLKHAGKKHLAGRHLEDAIEMCRLLTRHRCLGTISPWFSGRESLDDVFQTYRRVFTMLGKESLSCQLSIKPVNFAYDIGLFKDILTAAAEYLIPLQVDSFDLASAERTFALIEKGRDVYPLIGCTLPARWGRSMADVERVVEMQTPVRVIIGQWADPSISQNGPGDDFLKLVDSLSGRAVRISVATHNRGLAAEALRRIRLTNTPHEIEQLIGMPMVVPLNARIPNLDVRVYVPFGHPYLPYNVSDMRSRPRIAWYVLRDLLESRERRLEKVRQALAAQQHGKGPSSAVLEREILDFLRG